jgi:ABC-type microcin C transport system duplicated ATPase subunit YejF
MARMIAARLLDAVPTVLLVLTLVFVALRLLPGDPALVALGEYATPEQLGLFRREIAMIFQEPMSSLNPLMAIGEQVGEALLLHQSLDRSARRARVIELLGLVGIPDAAARLGAYPHQFSGGMRQRVMIAMRWPATRSC